MRKPCYILNPVIDTGMVSCAEDGILWPEDKALPWASNVSVAVGSPFTLAWFTRVVWKQSFGVQQVPGLVLAQELGSSMCLGYANQTHLAVERALAFTDVLDFFDHVAPAEICR